MLKIKEAFGRLCQTATKQSVALAVIDYLSANCLQLLHPTAHPRLGINVFMIEQEIRYRLVPVLHSPPQSCLPAVILEVDINIKFEEELYHPLMPAARGH